MAKDFTNNIGAAGAFINAPKTATKQETEQEALDRILEGKSPTERTKLLSKYGMQATEGRSKHVQILATPTLFEQIQEGIERKKYNTGLKKFSMNDAFEEAMTAWLKEQTETYYDV